ncbi:MAG: ParB/RepB/Spo0J family partition protein [Candidatus Eremiobacteraeota bacterium]|nr:ParB/RepB/Spo0J family partition protein [Candidatus Eremiobacteraeota bacterium]MBV9055705.1 ParB/RepB/Spo0J family partition protein [Candidatus Eremiobacteraeota bacterium]MBV9699209.1 ParB/RepB/Spo0J family partition protein [Candidatus Eremiobacteraeota bacterium]
MSDRKRGLGRGLAALLGESAVPVAAAHEVVRDIPLAEIRPNPFQPRKNFDEATLDELKASIAEYGVLVPIIVRRQGETYELIAGERRWRACAALSRATIPAIVRTSDDRQTLEFAIVENLQREDLNPLEEAAGFEHLMEEYGFTQEELSRRLGKSRPAVANALRLLGLPEPIKAMVAGGRLSAGHARALLGAPESMRLPLAERCRKEGLTVRALERLVERLKGTAPRRASAPHPLSPEERDFEARLRERFGTHVALVRYGSGGRIELRFADDAELMRLGDVLLGE